MQNKNPIGKTKDQGWQIGVRRTLPVDGIQAWAKITRALGLAPRDYEKGEMFETGDGTRVEIRSYKAGSLLRMRWQPTSVATDSTLQIRAIPAKTGTTIAIHQEQLANADQREAMRVKWTALLDDLKSAIDQP